MSTNTWSSPKRGFASVFFDVTAKRAAFQGHLHTHLNNNSKSYSLLQIHKVHVVIYAGYQTTCFKSLDWNLLVRTCAIDLDQTLPAQLSKVAANKLTSLNGEFSFIGTHFAAQANKHSWTKIKAKPWTSLSRKGSCFRSAVNSNLPRLRGKCQQETLI